MNQPAQIDRRWQLEPGSRLCAGLFIDDFLLFCYTEEDGRSICVLDVVPKALLSMRRLRNRLALRGFAGLFFRMSTGRGLTKSNDKMTFQNENVSHFVRVKNPYAIRVFQSITYSI